MAECVYIYYHPSRGYIYVGRTNNLSKRLYEHDHGIGGDGSLFCACRVYYAEFANKAETIIVETYLINEKKPFLNKSMKYPGKTKELRIVLPEFKYYRYRREQTANDITDNDKLELLYQPAYPLFEASLEVARLRGMLHKSEQRYSDLVQNDGIKIAELANLVLSAQELNIKLLDMLTKGA